MGRFDALTKLEEPKKTVIQPVVSPASTLQQPPKAEIKPREVKKTSKLANQQTSKEGVNPTNQEAEIPVSPTPHTGHMGDTSLLTTKEKTKYGTYLTNESIQKIRIRAIETNRDDHQVLQEAVNQFFEKLAK
jgi:hypothetical protein